MKLKRKINRVRVDNQRRENVWRNHTYQLKENEKWLDIWKYNGTTFTSKEELLKAIKLSDRKE